VKSVKNGDPYRGADGLRKMIPISSPDPKGHVALGIWCSARLSVKSILSLQTKKIKI
jgi:hypothetical protein